ncbi:MAG: hypothetical protein HY331_00970 [Chloroflexi bacterium]|nr:hypothetical protein [Chloroflexota bacterium]
MPHESAHAGIDRSEATYYAGMLLFSSSMLGLVLAADLIQLYVFWELTTVASFLLIGYDWRRPEARAGAVWSAAVTVGAGLIMLVGFLLVTAPVVSHVLARTACRAGVSLGPHAVRDDLAEDERRRAGPPAGS